MMRLCDSGVLKSALLLFLFGSFNNVFASNLLISPISRVAYQKMVGDLSILSYQFSITNNIPASAAQGLFLDKPILTYAETLPDLKFSTDCPFGSLTKYLKPKGEVGDSCFVRYESSIPQAIGKFFNQFNVADGLGGNNSSATFGVTVFPKGKLGHFVFEQNGTSISSLSLAPNENGTIILRNNTDIPITNVTISNLNQSGFTNVDCPNNGGTLAAHTTCSFSYNTGATPAANSFTITANGDNSDNSPLDLNIKVLSSLGVIYTREIAALKGREPIQWISPNFPNGLYNPPTSYPAVVSTVKDIMSSSNIYTITLNDGQSLQIIKDGSIGNAFHFTGNQSLYTTSSSINTAFTIVALMRKPTINIGRLLTGYFNTESNNLVGYWRSFQDAWWLQDAGRVDDQPQTTNANLYIFSNDNGTKTMYKYPVQGTAETKIQAPTTIGENNWGTVVYGRPLSYPNEAATNGYIYDVMIFDQVLTADQRAQIVTFYQSVYSYWT